MRSQDMELTALREQSATSSLQHANALGEVSRVVASLSDGLVQQDERHAEDVKRQLAVFEQLTELAQRTDKRLSEEIAQRSGGIDEVKAALSKLCEGTKALREQLAEYERKCEDIAKVESEKQALGLEKVWREMSGLKERVGMLAGALSDLEPQLQLADKHRDVLTEHTSLIQEAVQRIHHLDGELKAQSDASHAQNLELNALRQHVGTAISRVESAAVATQGQRLDKLATEVADGLATVEDKLSGLSRTGLEMKLEKYCDTLAASWTRRLEGQTAAVREVQSSMAEVTLQVEDLQRAQKLDDSSHVACMTAMRQSVEDLSERLEKMSRLPQAPPQDAKPSAGVLLDLSHRVTDLDTKLLQLQSNHGIEDKADALRSLSLGLESVETRLAQLDQRVTQGYAASSPSAPASSSRCSYSASTLESERAQDVGSLVEKLLAAELKPLRLELDAVTSLLEPLKSQLADRAGLEARQQQRCQCVRAGAGGGPCDWISGRPSSDGGTSPAGDMRREEAGFTRAFS
eukprot:TRINITY_DN26414_c0_g1_i2.p1 TRINITY_DN26414_c0_g1~~TRINITY_DN26414_c0_g1_i2.p1  ORF type:complete len:519 (-),score=136.91 TRINITY_DN26414_c0_g1_i2:157-1713(-)